MYMHNYISKKVFCCKSNLKHIKELTATFVDTYRNLCLQLMSIVVHDQCAILIIQACNIRSYLLVGNSSCAKITYIMQMMFNYMYLDFSGRRIYNAAL